MLRCKTFRFPEKLCQFVNDNNVQVVNITESGYKPGQYDEHYGYTLFYNEYEKLITS